MRYPKRERRRIEALRRGHPELRETLAFLGRVTDIAERLPTHSVVSPDRPARENGVHPIAPSRFTLDRDAAVEAFRSILEALRESTGSGTAETAMTALAEGRLDAGELVGAYCRGDVEPFESAAARLAVDAELLAGLAELAVKPQFVAAARSLSDRAGKAPTHSARCPACGSPPEMALVTDEKDAEAVMLAVCRLCESEWPVKRVCCLFCGNEDDDTLSYLQVEGEDEARVCVCDKCHRYLPVCDVRGRLESAPAVERAAIMHLDILAQSRGYEPLASATRSGSSE